jgi:hypothetical protein
MRMKEHLIDKRVVQRALQEGLLDKEAYQRMLDELPDLSHKVQTVAESQALEAASQARQERLAASTSGAAAEDLSYDDDDLDDDDDDDLDDDDDVDAEELDAAAPAPAAPAAEPGAPAAPSTGAHNVSDTLEMERPRIPGSYTPPDY